MVRGNKKKTTLCALCRYLSQYRDPSDPFYAPGYSRYVQDAAPFLCPVAHPRVAEPLLVVPETFNSRSRIRLSVYRKRPKKTHCSITCLTPPTFKPFLLIEGIVYNSLFLMTDWKFNKLFWLLFFLLFFWKFILIVIAALICDIKNVLCTVSTDK